MEICRKTLTGGQLAGGNSTSKREENDFYATDPQTTKLFLLFKFYKLIFKILK